MRECSRRLCDLQPTALVTPTAHIAGAQRTHHWSSHQFLRVLVVHRTAHCRSASLARLPLCLVALARATIREPGGEAASQVHHLLRIQPRIADQRLRRKQGARCLARREVGRLPPAGDRYRMTVSTRADVSAVVSRWRGKQPPAPSFSCSFAWSSRSRLPSRPLGSAQAGSVAP